MRMLNLLIIFLISNVAVAYNQSPQDRSWGNLYARSMISAIEENKTSYRENGYRDGDCDVRQYIEGVFTGNDNFVGDLNLSVSPEAPETKSMQAIFARVTELNCADDRGFQVIEKNWQTLDEIKAMLLAHIQNFPVN